MCKDFRGIQTTNTQKVEQCLCTKTKAPERKILK